MDALTLGLEDALGDRLGTDWSHPGPEQSSTQDSLSEPVHPLVGPHLEWASLLGRRTAEMHVALAGERPRPRLRPGAAHQPWIVRPSSTGPAA